MRADVENGRTVCRSETKSRPVPSRLSRTIKGPNSSLLERHRSESEAVGRCAVVWADHAIPKTPSTTSPQPPPLPKSRLVQQARTFFGAYPCHYHDRSMSSMPIGVLNRYVGLDARAFQLRALWIRMSFDCINWGFDTHPGAQSRQGSQIR
jgi:hypothetical protein